MPPAPAFDYYETLEIGKSATTEEIKSSYRRLALVHHPDRNPDNIDESTAAFQRIQIAHETLSNERSRAIYDTRSSRRSPFNDDGYYNEEDVDFDDFMHDFSREPFGSYSGGPYTRFFFGSGGFPFYGPSSMSPDEARKRHQEQEAAEAAWRKQMVDEVRRRRAAEEARVKAREMARAAEEREQTLAKERREQAEKARQEALWAQSKATTQAEKQGSCLHSAFWAKEKLQKKFKCTSCGQKRGMVGHRCPHCSLLVCQVCLNGIRKSP